MGSPSRKHRQQANNSLSLSRHSNINRSSHRDTSVSFRSAEPFVTASASATATSTATSRWGSYSSSRKMIRVATACILLALANASVMRRRIPCTAVANEEFLLALANKHNASASAIASASASASATTALLDYYDNADTIAIGEYREPLPLALMDGRGRRQQKKVPRWMDQTFRRRKVTAYVSVTDAPLAEQQPSPKSKQE